MSAITVHHLESSRSMRVLWLLEELGVDYDVVHYRRDPDTLRAPQSLATIHPLGKSPVVVLDGNVVLAESGAIIEELIDRYGAGRLRPPPGTEAYRRYRFWLHYAEGSLMPPLLVKLITTRIRNAPLPFFVRPVSGAIAKKIDEGFTDAEITKNLQFVERELSGRRWLTGEDLTGADVQMSYPLEVALTRGETSQEYPRAADFVEAIRARDAYARAMKRAGTQEVLGASPS